MLTEPQRLAIVAAALSADPRQTPSLARDHGFAGLLFDAFSTSLNLPDLSRTGQREFLRLLGSTDRQLVGLQVNLGIKGLGPGADVDRLLSQFDRVMESAADLAAPLVCVDLGPLPPLPEPPPEDRARPAISPEQAGLILIPPSPPLPSVPATPRRAASPHDVAFAAQVDSALAELGIHADRYGVVLAFRSDLSSFAALQRAVGSAGCPWYGIDLDPVSILRDVWNLDEVFSRLGPLVRHVRARDALCGADRRTQPAIIGRGDTRWDQLLDNLEAVAYQGWITLDPTELADRITAAVGGRKYLQLHAR